jgi:hypothetical protein
MKNNLLLTVLFVLGITLPIQMQAQEKEKGFFVEGSIALVDEHAKNDMEYICQNIYEFYYALTGKEKQTIFKRN